jgi:hypothetical protein
MPTPPEQMIVTKTCVPGVQFFNCQFVAADSRRLPRTETDHWGLKCIAADSNGLPRAETDHHGLQQLIVAVHGNLK